MTVKMTGGSSGNRESALPNVNVGFDSQVPQDTASNKGYPDLHYTQNTGNREGPKEPPVPTCGTPDDSAT